MDRLERPKVVASLTVKVVTGCGNMYVQMGWWQGRLREIFATLGRGGGCSMSISEALTRSITSGLRNSPPVPITEYIDQLRGIRCPTPMPFPKDDAVWSCPDAIAKTLKEYGMMTTEGLILFIQKLNSPEADHVDETEEAAAMRRIEELKADRDSQNLS